MITATIFVLFNLTSYFLALKRGPFWGLFAYMNIYFNTPNVFINWWAAHLPFHRWSLLTSVILVVSLFIHKKSLATHKFANTRWIFMFFFISAAVTFTHAVDKNDAYNFLYILFTFCLIIYIMLRSIIDERQLRLYLLAIVFFASQVSLGAYLHGKRVNERLEMSGAADAFGSNEFSLLLAGILPFVFSFLKSGTRIEKIVALGSLPFILNAFILCNSRGSTVALAAGVLIGLLVVADAQIKKGLLLIMIIMGPLFLYLTDDAFIQRLTTLIGIDSALENESEALELSSGRTEIWQYGIEMSKDNPAGVGPNGFKKLARFYMPQEVLSFKGESQIGVRAAHNTYLQVLVEQGWAGLTIWLMLCLHSGVLSKRAFKIASSLNAPNPFLKNTIFALNVGFISALVGGLVNSRIYYEFFWWQLALIAITYSLVKKLKTDEDRNDPHLENSSTTV